MKEGWTDLYLNICDIALRAKLHIIVEDECVLTCVCPHYIESKLDQSGGGGCGLNLPQHDFPDSKQPHKYAIRLPWDKR